MSKKSYNSNAFFHVLLSVGLGVSLLFGTEISTITVSVLFAIYHVFFILHGFDKKILNEEIWFVYLLVPFYGLITLKRKVYQIEVNEKKIKIDKTNDSISVGLDGIDSTLVIVKSGDSKDDPVLMEALRKAVNENLL